MMTDLRLWHGGIPGLKIGDILEPGHERHTHDGCASAQILVWTGHDVRGDGGTDEPSAYLSGWLTRWLWETAGFEAGQRGRDEGDDE